MRRWILGVAALLLALPALAAGEGAGTLAEIKGWLAGTRDFSARFVQVTHLAAVDIDQSAGGTVLFARGGRMRWEYEGDDPQVIVSDGMTVWMHQVRDRTAMRREVASLSPAARLALDLLGGMAEVESWFTASGCGEGCVALTPKSPDPDLKLVKVEAFPGGAVKAVTTTDALDNVTRIDFSQGKRNGGADLARFAFDPPSGVEVLDASGSAR